MSAVVGFFRWVETVAVEGRTFHGFELNFANENWMLVKYLQPPNQIIDAIAPLLCADIPIEIPQTIPSGTQIDDNFTAPADLSYAFSRVQTFHEAAKPTAPIEANVIIAQAFLESSVQYYVEGDLIAGMELPGDNSPSDYEPDANGWYYPPYADFDFEKIPVSQRSVSFQTASLNWLYSWVYNGCSDMDEDFHIMKTLDEATFNINGIYTWSTAQYVNCCNAGVGSGYLIESGSGSGNEWVDVWVFSPETAVARHFHPTLLLDPDYIDMAPIVQGAAMIFGALFQTSPLGNVRLKRRFFNTGKRPYILGDQTSGILGDQTSGILGHDKT